MERSALPFQRSHPSMLWGQSPSCCAQMQISHYGDACLCWYAGHLYMNQKMCYLMEGYINSWPTPTAISPETSGQASNICPGSVPRKVCWTLFYLPARAILALASLCGRPRCSVDWSLSWSLFITLAWRSTTLRYWVNLPLCFLSVFVFLSLDRPLWLWCLSSLSKGFKRRLPVSN